MASSSNSRNHPSRAKRQRLGTMDDDWRDLPISNLGSLVRIMFEKKVSTDVIIKVGSGAKMRQIECHSLVLKGHSPVFEAMLSDRWTKSASESEETNGRVISLEEDNSDNFYAFVQMLYSDWDELDFQYYHIPDGVTPAIAVGVFALAHKYLATHIIRRAEHVIHSVLHERIIDQIVDVFINLKRLPLCDKGQVGRKVLKTAENCVLRYAKRIFSTTIVLKFNCSELAEIVRSSSLQCNEDTVYNGCLTWAVEQCNLQKIDPHGVNMRYVLGDVIQEIRFPLLDDESFTNRVAFSGILSHEELTELFAYRVNKDCVHISKKDMKFLADKRITTNEISLMRSDTCSTQTKDFSSPHGFEMTVSQEINISMLWFYCGNEKTKYDIKVEFMYKNQQSENTHEVRDVATKEIVDTNIIGMAIVPQVRVPKDIPVIIKFTISGGKTYFADEDVAPETKEVVICNNGAVVFTFRNKISSFRNGLKQLPELEFNTTN